MRLCDGYFSEITADMDIQVVQNEYSVLDYIDKSILHDVGALIGKIFRHECEKISSHVNSRFKRNSQPESKLSNLPQMVIYGPSESKMTCYSEKCGRSPRKKV